ncbi:tripartite tricarboxylate transporter TctB family protein [Oceanobacillus alkalisoli]|uniref:tripartite tricarboxylate transporter TctB family protein n=1 Tax=Oceanobacillus alkalisoli TaxID=2925113 RepID=UPI001EE3DC43|nr:tripartite tricarboxylate transporter TctB family protein [Oceanobacillus alkalisoli]MCG5103229.1 tripartite tricarboxylate transporter TctB family protein [Oceanobacillus alkalisoli]
MTRNKEAILFLSIGILGILSGIFIFPIYIPDVIGKELITPGFFPFLALFIIIISAIAEAISIMKKKDKTEKREFWEKGKGKQAAIIIAIFVFYIFVAINLFGFYLASLLLLIGVIRYLGEKRWWMSLIISIGVIGIIHLLFNMQLGVNFPNSIFF